MTVEQPVRVKESARTGACLAPRCSCASPQDVELVGGWPTCSCGHTVGGHEPGEQP